MIWSNYFKTASRNLFKEKSTSVIHLLGMAVGMTVAILIGLWIHDELTFNRYHIHYHQIGIVMVSETRDGEIGTTRITGVPLGNELKRSFRDDFKFIVKSTQLNEYTLSKAEKIFTASGKYMDADGPEMFSIKMIRGSRQGLIAPNSILLSSTLARKFFGDEDPVNQVLTLNRKSNVLVTGVYEDIPYNSELYKMEFMAPWELYVLENKWVQDIQGSWRDNFLKTFVQLNSAEAFGPVSAKIRNIKRIHAEATVAERKPVVFIQPMARWHLFSSFENGVEVTSDLLKWIWMYGTIGLLVLSLACINFINLSTARSAKRTKEIGVRKTLGSAQKQLVFQFFCESFLLCLFAFALGIGISGVLLPWFNQVAEKDLVLPMVNPFFWLTGFVFVLFSAILAGLYPSLFLSSFHPVRALKNQGPSGKKSTWLRKTLVVFQFTLSIALIISTGIIYRQIEHTRDRPLGYDQSGLVELKFASSNDKSLSDVLETELKKSGVIQSMAVTGGELTQVWSNNGGFEWRDKDPEQIAYFGTLAVSPSFGRTIGWKIAAGRDFSPLMAGDTNGLILNESAVKVMGLQNPVGEFIQRKTYDGKIIKYQVLGVAGDILMASPFEPAKPSVFFIAGFKSRTILRLNPGQSVQDALAKIESIHKKVLPDAPFDYRFIDDAFGEKFKQEIRMSKLSAFFALLAVFISCLGLYGLASYLAETRTKEIGIRKILGAPVYAILWLLSRDFLWQIACSILIASSIAYYVMNKWLQNYQYRTEMPWWIFAIAAFIAIMIAVCTVSILTIRAANAKPVKALHVE